MAQKQQQQIFQKFFEGYIFTFLSLNTHTGGVEKVIFSVPGRLDWTKMAFFCLKMHIFAIVRWFLVQKLQITYLCAFVRCLIALFPIVTHKQNRIKNILLRILAH